MAKRRISSSRRAQLRRQARINFGHSRSTRRGKTQVARKRRSGRRSGRKGFFGLKGMTGLLVGAGVYGAGRQYLSNAIAPVTSKIPLGTVTDEVALMLLGSWVAKRGGMLGEIGRAAAVVEASRIGVALSDGSAFAVGSSSSSSQPTTIIG